MKSVLVLVKILGVRCLYAYPSCSRCFRKVRELDEERRFWCSHCQRHYKKDVVGYRYHVNMTVADYSGMARVTIFGTSLERFFGLTATEFCRHVAERERVESLPCAGIDRIIHLAMEKCFLGCLVYLAFHTAALGGISYQARNTSSHGLHNIIQPTRISGLRNGYNIPELLANGIFQIRSENRVLRTVFDIFKDYVKCSEERKSIFDCQDVFCFSANDSNGLDPVEASNDHVTLEQTDFTEHEIVTPGKVLQAQSTEHNFVLSMITSDDDSDVGKSVSYECLSTKSSDYCFQEDKWRDNDLQKDGFRKIDSISGECRGDEFTNDGIMISFPLPVPHKARKDGNKENNLESESGTFCKEDDCACFESSSVFMEKVNLSSLRQSFLVAPGSNVSGIWTSIVMTERRTSASGGVPTVTVAAEKDQVKTSVPTKDSGLSASHVPDSNLGVCASQSNYFDLSSELNALFDWPSSDDLEAFLGSCSLLTARENDPDENVAHNQQNNFNLNGSEEEKIFFPRSGYVENDLFLWNNASEDSLNREGKETQRGVLKFVNADQIQAKKHGCHETARNIKEIGCPLYDGSTQLFSPIPPCFASTPILDLAENSSNNPRTPLWNTKHSTPSLSENKRKKISKAFWKRMRAGSFKKRSIPCAIPSSTKCRNLSCDEEKFYRSRNIDEPASDSQTSLADFGNTQNYNIDQTPFNKSNINKHADEQFAGSFCGSPLLFPYVTST